MLEILGIIAGNILSLPGILGLALGMTTRSFPLGCGMGAFIGMLSTLIFVGFGFAAIEPLELVIAVVIGIMAGALGTLIRRYGATV
ncbi:hypothetical protein [Amaricoccus macauensis]|uniref:hypothetical protein n=1 Tax=Amaricoccus macauensis TaxID=57001 RepID=UPI003C79CCB5